MTGKLPEFCVFITRFIKVPCKIFPFFSNDPLEKSIEFKHAAWSCEIAIIQSSCEVHQETLFTLCKRVFNGACPIVAQTQVKIENRMCKSAGKKPLIK